MPKLYRKKPVVVEAIQFDRHADLHAKEIIEWSDGAVCWSAEEPEKLAVSTLEGLMTVSQGDYIIKGIAGEFYPCKMEIFHATYEAVE